jgi:hypothetical protein
MHYSIKFNFTAENRIFHISVLNVVRFVYKVKQHVTNNGIDNVLVDIKNNFVATLALACDQGKGVARCGPNSRPGSAIV